MLPVALVDYGPGYPTRCNRRSDPNAPPFVHNGLTPPSETKEIMQAPRLEPAALGLQVLRSTGSTVPTSGCNISRFYLLRLFFFRLAKQFFSRVLIEASAGGLFFFPLPAEQNPPSMAPRFSEGSKSDPQEIPSSVQIPSPPPHLLLTSPPSPHAPISSPRPYISPPPPHFLPLLIGVGGGWGDRFFPLVFSFGVFLWCFPLAFSFGGFRWW